MNCCPGSMDCGEKEKEQIGSSYSTLECCNTQVSVRPCSKTSPQARHNFHRCPWNTHENSVKPDHTESQFPVHPTICRKSSPSVEQPAADEPSTPVLRAHPFLWIYPSAEIWSSARIPERPDCADLDLVVLLAVELQSLEIQQALGVLCPRSFWY